MVREKSKTKLYICTALAVTLLIICKVLPVPQGLTREGFCAMCLFLGTVVLWLGEVFPMWVSAMLMYFLFPWYGVMTVSECYTNFGGSSCFFILATFAIAAAMSTTSIPGRVCSSVIAKFGRNSKLLVLAIIMATTVLSMMMSTITVVAIFVALLRPIVKEHCGTSKESNLAKCIYLGLPIACNLGGFMALSSTPGNIVSNDILESFAGMHVNYFQWMAVGLPTSILFKILAWFVITKVFPPEPLKEEVIVKYSDLQKDKVPMTVREIKAVVIILVMITLWLLSGQISFLNNTVVAVVAMALFLAPGINVLTPKELNDNIQWGTVMLLGTISGLVSGITMHNVPDWIVNTVFVKVSGLPMILVLFIAVAFMAVMRNFIPTGTAFVSFMSLPMLGLAKLVGINLYVMMFLVSFWSSIICVVPYDPIYFAGYFDGYYTVSDTSKTGIRMLLLFVLLSPIVITALTLLAT